ncbi:MAG: uroporphyrinogen-III synthase [Planctomycetota bacterium]|nr:uroporphyrinogen-III synthase [Planctomycetota bacterium]
MSSPHGAKTPGESTVLVTRTEEQGTALRERLESLGARVISVPAIRFVESEDIDGWNAALERREAVTHLLFTSRIAARFFCELSERAGVSRELWRGCRIAAVGTGTAEYLRRQGLETDFVPRHSTGIGLATELVEHERLGPESAVLLPQSQLARPEVADFLRAAGCSVLTVSLYETLPEEPAHAAPLLELIDRGGRIDVAVFASPSALSGFVDMTGERGRRILQDARIVSIGPTTSRALREAGLEVSRESTRPDVEALTRAIVDALSDP